MPSSEHSLDTLLHKYGDNPEVAAARSQAAWQKYVSGWSFQAADLGIEEWAPREVQWHAYNLRAGLTYDSFYDEHILNQGGNYLYEGGLQGAARDPISHVMPFAYDSARPDGTAQFVKEILRYTLRETGPDPRTGFPAGWLPWGLGAFGMIDSDGFWPSDLQNYIILTAAQYVLAQRDFSFLDEHLDDKRTVGDTLWSCFLQARDSTGVGVHNLTILLNVDHNDGLLGHLRPPNKTVAQLWGESVMNSALAVYAYKQFAEVLLQHKLKSRAQQLIAQAELLRTAAAEHAWTGKWYKRVWLGSEANGGWRGDDRDGVMWTETQAWALLADFDRADDALVEELKTQAILPSYLGAFNAGKSNGTGDYAGFWWCGELALMGGLGRHGHSQLAAEAWRKSSMALKGETYPDIWFGVFSGPDTLNSQLMAADPQFKGQPESYAGSTRRMTLGFPVMNMWTHTTPLYSILSVLGTTFTGSGVILRPMNLVDLTNASGFAIHTPLLGLTRAPSVCCGLGGWYRPSSAGEYEITIHLAGRAKACCQGFGFATDDGSLLQVQETSDGGIIFKGHTTYMQDGHHSLSWKALDAWDKTLVLTTLV